MQDTKDYRKEFEDKMQEEHFNCGPREPFCSYAWGHIEWAWVGFCLAKNISKGTE